VLTLTLRALSSAALALSAPLDLSAFSIGCRAETNLTAPLGLAPDGTTPVATSLECGYTAGGFDGSVAPLTGDVGAMAPTVSLARRYDADDADSLFGPDDQLTVSFSIPTDLGGYALGTTLTRGQSTDGLRSRLRWPPRSTTRASGSAIPGSTSPSIASPPPRWPT